MFLVDINTWHDFFYCAKYFRFPVHLFSQSKCSMGDKQLWVLLSICFHRWLLWAESLFLWSKFKKQVEHSGCFFLNQFLLNVLLKKGINLWIISCFSCLFIISVGGSSCSDPWAAGTADPAASPDPTRKRRRHQRRLWLFVGVADDAEIFRCSALRGSARRKGNNFYQNTNDHSILKIIEDWLWHFFSQVNPPCSVYIQMWVYSDVFPFRSLHYLVHTRRLSKQ